MTRHLVTLVFAALLTGGIYLTIQPPADADADVVVVHETPRVRVDRASSAPDHRELTVYGVTRAADRTVLAFAVPGRMLERHVEVGDTVTAGDLVAVVDEAPMRNEQRAASAAIDDLQARLDQVERERQRVQDLIAADLGTGQALDSLDADARSLEAGLDAARARLSEARRLRGETELRAPFDGVVTDVLVEPGQVVAAGTPVLVVTGASGAEVEVGVPETAVARIRVGAQVAVRFPLTGSTSLTGTVTHIARASGPGRLFPVTVALPPDADTMPGVTAEVDLRLPEPAGVAVPVGAVVDPTGAGAAVFAVHEGTARRVPVHIRRITGDLAVVDGELVPGTEVVVAGMGGITDGDAVEVAR